MGHVLNSGTLIACRETEELGEQLEFIREMLQKLFLDCSFVKAQWL
jgi:hypothetical protein